VELHELVRCLDNGGSQQIDLKKRMRRVAKKDKVLDVPLGKHELEKVVVLLSWIFMRGNERERKQYDMKYLILGFVRQVFDSDNIFQPTAAEWKRLLAKTDELTAKIKLLAE